MTMSLDGWPLAEPYKTKMIEWIELLPAPQREAALRRAGYNPFKLLAQEVYIDLLTDSGTSAMSQEQWSALMRGDESYAGSLSFQELERAVRDVLGFPFVLPTHQGRAAEHVLFRALAHAGDLVANNLHFDTTKAHVLAAGATPVDLVVPEGEDPEGDFPFKGNIDLERLDALLRDEGGRVAVVMTTVTSNNNGGQPVALANLRAASEIAHRHGKLFFLDAARFAENAYLIQQRESGQASRSVAEIARDMMACADGCTMSAKKDPMVNIGGFVALRDQDLYRRLRDFCILYEGYATYGGLAGRDLAALAQGLREAVYEPHLRYRVAQVGELHAALQGCGVPVMSPAGGHGVYIDAGRMLDHLPRDVFPGWALSVEFYRERGIRCVEIGTVLAGRDARSGEHDYPPLDLVRLAIPRRVYSQAHLAQVAEAARRILARRRDLAGYRFTYEPATLRHFAAEFAPLA